jgi:hypothetical protein
MSQTGLASQHYSGPPISVNEIERFVGRCAQFTIRWICSDAHW